MSLTRLQLQTDIGELLRSLSVTTTEIQSAINVAIDIAREWQVYWDGVDETLVWATDTWEYAVPTAFVCIYRLTHQDSDNIYSIWVPDHHWRIIPATAPVFLFHPDLVDWATAGKKLRVEGQKIQARLTADTSVLHISDALVKELAVSILHEGLALSPATPAELRGVHLAASVRHTRIAEEVLARHAFRPAAGSRFVPGVDIT